MSDNHNEPTRRHKACARVYNLIGEMSREAEAQGHPPFNGSDILHILNTVEAMFLEELDKMVEQLKEAERRLDDMEQDSLDRDLCT